VTRLRVQGALAALINAGLDPRSADAEHLRRIRTLNLSTLAILLLALPFMAMYFAFGVWRTAALLSVTVTASLGNMYLLRRTRRTRLCGQLGISILFGQLVAAAIDSGGFHQANFSWLYVVPLAAATLLDRRGALVWLGICAITFLGFWGLAEIGMQLRSIRPDEARPILALASHLTALAALGLLAAGFISSQRRLEAELRWRGEQQQREARYVRLLHDAAVAANDSSSLLEMLRRAVDIICGATGWPVGLVYTSPSQARRMLRATEIRHVADEGRFGRFARHYRPAQRARSGDPARCALAARSPIWIEDVRNQPRFRRARLAEEAGLGAGIAFPMEIEGRVGAVFEFFASGPLERDERMLEYLRQIASQIGRAAQRVQMLERIHALASFDSLTGLPNRWSFQQRLHAAIELAERHNHRLAILFLDLDGFKAVNDTLGHDVGDQLLTAVASRVSRTVRTRDCVARDNDGSRGAESGLVSRLAGDEFMVLLPQIPSDDVAKKVAERILRSLRAPFELEGRELFTDASIGIALYPDHGTETSALIRSADVAMYEAKSRGRSNFQFFDGTIGSSVAQRLTLHARLRRAVESEDFELHYQPVRHARLGHVVGAEALLRWHDSELGTVPPIEFVAAAEECGQIGALGAWVLRTAAAQAKCWVDAGLHPIRIAVNISGHQLRHPSILETIREALEASGLGAGWLELELTESTIIRDDQLTNKILREISELGVGLALDDFGTGFSSLSNLRRLPIGRVKIDRSFVADLPRCQDDCAVVGAIIAMAHSLRIPVVAEGVETEEQLEFLRERGCEEVQGYLFSPAVPPEALTRMLELEKEDGLGAV